MPEHLKGLKVKHYIYLAIILILINAFAFIAKQNGWDAHAKEWLNLLLRWFHVIIGITWIGASFYFIWLENNLNRSEGLRDELAGNLWAVHGGGFYYLEKYKISPKELPKKLHWFQWEAYLTWISGFLLMIVVYYSKPALYLVDPSVLNMPGYLAVIIGITLLFGGWVIYDALCKSKLVEKKMLFALLGFVLVSIMAFALTKIFSGRGAYMHLGAMLGTMMAANVFYVIIPAQKAMVRAAKEGKIVDPQLGKNAGLRSLHNNYMTLPVVFIMISNHFPMTYNYQFNWLVLMGLFLASAFLRHYLNESERGKEAALILPIVTLAVLVMAFITAPAKPQALTLSSEQVTFSEVQSIIDNRCVTCHAAAPSHPSFSAAPKGVMLETPLQIQSQAAKIMEVSVTTNYMPLANMTGMLEEERALVGAWISQGAHTQ